MDSEVYKAHAKHLVDSHDQLLVSTLETGSYKRLYSFKHIVNGFAVHTTASQVPFNSFAIFSLYCYKLVIVLYTSLIKISEKVFESPWLIVISILRLENSKMLQEWSWWRETEEPH